MIAVIQRASSAELHIEGRLHASIEKGFVVLLGIHVEDSVTDVDYLVGKIHGLRIFSDADGKMNLSLEQVGGQILLVSQFTLHADTRKGNRPSYMSAARPEQAIPLYEDMIRKLTNAMGSPIQTGIFGADMKVSLCNDGPVTIIIDSKNPSL